LIAYTIAANATIKLGTPIAIPEMSPALRFVPPELLVLVDAARLVEVDNEVEESHEVKVLAVLDVKIVDELL